MLFDTHCHLDDDAFDVDRSAVLTRASEAGVGALLIPAVRPEHWARVAALHGRSREGVQCVFGLGLHPLALGNAGTLARQWEALDAALLQPGCVAVGECGLDAPCEADGIGWDVQAAALARQLALAQKHGLPALVHCRGAHGRLLALLEATPGPTVVLHSYSGPAELVPQYARLGCFFSFAGPVTRAGARRPLAALRAVPPERLLLETDAPFQPLGGRSRTEPAHLREIAVAAAAALGMDLGALAARTTQAARSLFAVGAASRHEAP